MLHDYASCSEQAKAVKADPNDPHLKPVNQSLGAAVGAMVWTSIETNKAQQDFMPRCMRGLGYSAIVLTDREVAEAKALVSSDDHSRWVERFYASPDFAERLQRAVIPPLPTAMPEPFTYGALRIDPGSLAPALGAVGRDGTMLRFKASYRLAGVLRYAVDLPEHGSKHFAARSPIRQALLPSNDRSSTATWWCVPIECLTDDANNGWIVHRSTGATWIPTDLDGEESEKTGDMVLRIDFDAPAPPPFDAFLVVRKLNAASVKVEGLAANGSDWETFWTMDVPLDAQGQAILPFWTKKLILTRSEGGIAITVSPDGDGTGLPYTRVTD